MNCNNKSFYQQKLDQMLKPELWLELSMLNSVYNKENFEKNLTKKLSSIAREYFKQRESKFQQPRSECALIGKFFELGAENRWLTKDKLESLEEIAKKVGLIGRTTRARVSAAKVEGGIAKLIIDIIQNHNKEVDKRDRSPIRESKEIRQSKKGDCKDSSAESDRVKAIMNRLRLTGDYDEVDELGRSLLHRSVRIKDLELSKALIEHDADLDLRDSKGLTPLHYAAKSSEGRILDFMLKKGVNLEVRSRDNETPLFLAVKADRKDNVEKLLDAKAIIDHRNIEGKTALHLSLELPDLSKIVKLLIDRDSDLDIQDRQGWTPLFQAVSTGNCEGVELLVESGANPQVMDKKGRDVLHVLKENNHANYEEIKRQLTNFSGLVMTGKEQLHRRMITHIIEEKVYSQLVTEDDKILTQKNSYEGMTDFYALKKLLRSFVWFAEDYPSHISYEVIEMITETVEMAMSVPQPFEELRERWLNGKPILINAGYVDHYVSMIFWNDILVVCNRGSGCVIEGVRSTQRMYRFRKDKLTVDILKKIDLLQESGDKSKYVKFISTELPKLLDFKDEPFKEEVSFWALSKQVIGNCAWANGEAGIFALMWLHSLIDYDPSLEKIDDNKVSEIISTQNEAILNYRLYNLISVVNKYIKWMKNPGNKLVPDFKRLDVAMSKQVVFCCTDPEIEKKWKKAKTDWKEAKSFWQSGKLSREKYFRFST